MTIVGKNLILKYNKAGNKEETRLLQVYEDAPAYLKGWDPLKGGWRTFSKSKITKSKIFGRFNR